ncbi:sterile alpha motif domain-containing protein 13 isoform X1 [Carcharodon carcharias]|uniref:sterile alpha motif domain-containing protein 13 isoform X1 n=1 Tax=Carcharodon carcharias TaxID=13397 RepID=UPI001B7ED303|nr:sterile alpha motif domain-containing protein 13 isoform X1 [Carcharodon carcharias]
MEMKYKEWILETIDSLRSRKARPDVERICRMIERRHGLSPAETQQQLDKLVRAELVVKVAYKGSNSYRNAAKWYKNKQRKKAAGAGPDLEGGGNGILQAVETLLLQRQSQSQSPSQQQEGEARHLLLSSSSSSSSSSSQRNAQQERSDRRGVSLREIEKYISGSQHLSRKLGKARLQLALKREVHRGRLVQTAAGNCYLLPPERRDDAKLLAAGAVSARAVPGHKGYARTRKEKTIEANASLINPPAAATSPDSECMEPELKEIEEWRNPDLEQDACETESVELASKQNNCKNNKASDYTHPTESSVFLNCDTYKKSRGMNGHTQDVSGHPTDQWLYGECVTSSREEAAKRTLLVRLPSPDPALKNDTAKEEAEQRAAVPELRGASCLPTPSASPVEMESIESGSNKSPTENSKLLDPAEWTILDVFNYFKKAGFEDQAVAFQEQEIDGKSLLLMKRSDVLTGLSIKLGPALKIYEYHVKALQMRHLKGSSS